MQLTKKMISLVLALVLTYGTLLPLAQAADFDYPELSVTPRASDRIESEAAKESQRRLGTYLPFQFSAGMTLLAGIVTTSYKKPDTVDSSATYGPWAGIAVGGAWLALTTGMYMYYEPYASAQKEIGALPKKNTRDALTRERMAEERLESVAKLSYRLKWMSVITNLAATGYMMSKVEQGSFGQLANGLAMVSALAPLVFRPYWEEVADAQLDYKKRIYSPVASLGYLPDPATGGLAPGLTLSMRF